MQKVEHAPAKQRRRNPEAGVATATGSKPIGKMVEEGRSSVSEEHLFRPDGRRERILSVDANSSTFTDDLTLLFEKNVARAIRAHKKKLSSAGRVD